MGYQVSSEVIVKESCSQEQTWIYSKLLPGFYYELSYATTEWDGFLNRWGHKKLNSRENHWIRVMSFKLHEQIISELFRKIL